MTPRIKAVLISTGFALTATLTLAAEPRLAHRDFTLVAGKPAPKDCYPQLVRVEKKDGQYFVWSRIVL